MKPKISVVIPAYNSGRYLDEAVQSVVAQTFTDWECIVIDDGSTEDLSRVKEMDPRVRLIHQPNRGTAAARNNGILSTTGEFIAFLDHDDIWIPTKLAAQLAVMAGDDGIGFCNSEHVFVDSEGISLDISGWKPTTDYLQMLREFKGILPSATMLRRSLLPATGLFEPLYRAAGEDYDLFLKFARISRLGHVPAVQLKYRVHGGNLSMQYLTSLGIVKNIREKHMLQAGACDTGLAEALAEMRESILHSYASAAYSAARRSVRSGDMRGASTHLARALRWWPAYTLKSLLMFPIQRATRRPDSR